MNCFTPSNRTRSNALEAHTSNQGQCNIWENINIKLLQEQIFNSDSVWFNTSPQTLIFSILFFSISSILSMFNIKWHMATQKKLSKGN